MTTRPGSDESAAIDKRRITFSSFGALYAMLSVLILGAAIGAYNMARLASSVERQDDRLASATKRQDERFDDFRRNIERRLDSIESRLK